MPYKKDWDGRSTDAWSQNWLPRDERPLPVAPRKQGAPRRVSEYINSSTTSWNSKLEEFFLPTNVEVIKGIPLCLRNQDDFSAWHYEKTDVFSVRSAYRTLVTTKSMREEWLDGRRREDVDKIMEVQGSLEGVDFYLELVMLLVAYRGHTSP
jgi:hypothetical protein